jgi:hypothetical protein
VSISVHLWFSTAIFPINLFDLGWLQKKTCRPFRDGTFHIDYVVGSESDAAAMATVNKRLLLF